MPPVLGPPDLALLALLALGLAPSGALRRSGPSRLLAAARSALAWLAACGAQAAVSALPGPHSLAERCRH